MGRAITKHTHGNTIMHTVTNTTVTGFTDTITFGDRSAPYGGARAVVRSATATWVVDLSMDGYVMECTATPVTADGGGVPRHVRTVDIPLWVMATVDALRAKARG